MINTSNHDFMSHNDFSNLAEGLTLVLTCTLMGMVGNSDIANRGWL